MREQGAPAPRTSRRHFLHQLGVWAIGAIFSTLLAVPLLGYFLSVLTRRSSEQWVRVASLDQINSDTPALFRVAFKGESGPVPFEIVQGVFAIRRGSEILAFSNVCTHMGCSVRWLDWRQQILCPCHGGMYDRWGILLGGPPASNLPFYLSKVEGNYLYVANRMIRRGVTLS